MGTISKRTKKNLQGQQYHWKFQSVVKELLDENKECFICRTKKDLDIHHIKQCKSYNEEFHNPNNLVVVCRKCHHDYHVQYPEQVNVKTFMEYTKNRSQRKLQSNYDKLRITSQKEIEELKRENLKLKQQLGGIE